jgi:hypothetical protein
MSELFYARRSIGRVLTVWDEATRMQTGRAG